MRRKENEIKDRKEVEALLQRADVCRLAFVDGDEPYIVPVNFGFKGNCLYFHSAKEGRKMDIIKRNNKVCFEVDVDYELEANEIPCTWSMKYRSVIGLGRAFVIEDLDEKRKALDILLEHYSGKAHHGYTKEKLEGVAVIRLEVDEMTGKSSGY